MAGIQQERCRLCGGQYLSSLVHCVRPEYSGVSGAGREVARRIDSRNAICCILMRDLTLGKNLSDVVARQERVKSEKKELGLLL